MFFFSRSKVFKVLAVFLAGNLFTQAVFPFEALALTSGPSQPEVQSFEPVGTTEMVDLFSGDFNYNIPLFELPGPNGGYPFNLIYNSGIGMDQEASWVGLGWNLNPGAITRQMRGLPDEYDGAVITKEADIQPNVTFGTTFGGTMEVFGADASVGLQVGMGVSVFYNNYKGIGYSLEPNCNLSLNNTGGMAGGVGLNLSLNSQEGIAIQPSLSVSGNAGTLSFGVGYDSRQGLHEYSAGVQLGKYIDLGGTLPLNTSGYTPNIELPMAGRSIDTEFKLGISLWGLDVCPYARGFFSTQYLKEKEREIQAYGYLNYQNGYNNDNALLDFNREGDGTIRKTSPNLAIPNLTNDLYAATGHGVVGTFRPFRNDAGGVFDPKVESVTVGGSIGVDLGLGYGPHLGVGISVNYSKATSGKWTEFRDWPVAFKTSNHNSLYEPVVFKNYGELTPDPVNDKVFMGGEAAVVAQLSQATGVPDRKWRAKDYITVSDADFQFIPGNQATEREPRNSVMQYVEGEGNQSKGLEVLNPNGSRYVYNKVVKTNQIECQYSSGDRPKDEVCDPTIAITAEEENESSEKFGAKPMYKYPNTEKYFARNNLPAFPYAYLLNEVKGADYVDVDGNGISENDLGYWVKFSYNETSANNPDFIDKQPLSYNWRVPFTGAQYGKGLHTTFQDDRGSYIYGTKEIQYMTSVETKTHIAKFVLSKRSDNRGAYDQLQNGTTKLGAYTYKLDKILLYSKADQTKPIKTIFFEYSYELCKGVPNNDGSIDPKVTKNDGGKLTLKKVYFTYGNNTRGSLSPYEFNYNQDQQDQNPGYNNYSFDRWGYYQPLHRTITDKCYRLENPYVDQFDAGDPLFKEKTDKNKAVWSLKTITLPSGAVIQIDYEADDYAYVQNKTATQMFAIASLMDGNTAEGTIDHQRWADGDKRRVYFKLEKPVSANLSPEEKTAELNKYFDGLDKLFFKVYMYVRKWTDKRKDYISGYADIEAFGFDENSKSGTNYTRGWVQMGRPRIGKKGGPRTSPYHNFSVAAWQYIRTMQPQLAGFGPFTADPNTQGQAVMDKTKSLVSIIPTVLTTLTGFDLYAYENGWGNLLDLSRSFIRLNSPDKKKLGGGHRVKRIMISDNWNVEAGDAQGVYGQVYDYTMEEGGTMISSGVASYEPAMGNDENPWKTAKEYTDAIPLKTNNNLFFEGPINESYFPSPMVGYRKVTVTSLATYYSKATEPDGTNRVDPPGVDIPSGIKTSGATVNEFYTFKEFPVIVDETAIDIKTNNFIIPVPFVGQYTVNSLTASQGYSIVLNDMHGRVKKISHYKQTTDGSFVWDKPVSSVEYFYSSINTKGRQKLDYYKLNNANFKILTEETGSAAKIETRSLGVDYEFFSDFREQEIETSGGGLNMNVDLLMFLWAPFPVVGPWPSVSKSTTRVRTIVLNKIIHKSGILTSVKAINGESSTTVTNEVFDETGTPVLTKTVNEFNKPVYSYNIPAHLIYEGMSMAYKNIGFKFNGSVQSYSSSKKINEVLISGADVTSMLTPGDEFLIGSNGKAVFVKKESGKFWFTISSDYTGTFTLTRSGKRNLLGERAGNITSLSDPTVQ